MTIAQGFQREATEVLSGKQPIVDPRTGLPTTYFLRLFQSLRADTLGAARVIPCNATAENSGGVFAITLTPTHPVAPLIQGYRDFDCFVFVANDTSSADVTITVVPEKGSLAALKAYVSDGATQAVAGDVNADRLYLAIFSDHLDGGAGGFVLK